ncbi:MAG: MFS transporter [Verrucomicrobia bacterium]|nr:MFS transporter [Verrucomicrobiota bacterium]
MQGSPRWIERGELTALFFLHGMALGTWFVPLSRVLEAHGFGAIKPLAFATSALAAFVSPLIFGAMADRQAAPVQVLRGLALATAAAMALAATAIRWQWNPWVTLALIQLHALCSSPTWSISNTIVLARLTEPRRQFGPIRAMATLGWMAGCWLVSALGADASTVSGYTGAAVWLGLAAFTYVLPSVTPPATAGRLTVRQRLGLDALALLKKSDNRVVFLTTALFAIPLAAFYPYTPLHLRQVGFEHTTAWMSLGQVSEIASMLLLAGLLSSWRVKWILGLGLVFGVLRFALCAMDSRTWLLAGGGAARLFVRSGLDHRPDLRGRAGGSRLARPGAGPDVADEQRGGESAGLSGHRLVVRHVRSSRRAVVVAVLGRAGGAGGHGAGLLPGRLPRHRHRHATDEDNRTGGVMGWLFLGSLDRSAQPGCAGKARAGPAMPSSA